MRGYMGTWKKNVTRRRIGECSIDICMQDVFYRRGRSSCWSVEGYRYATKASSRATRSSTLLPVIELACEGWRPVALRLRGAFSPLGELRTMDGGPSIAISGSTITKLDDDPALFGWPNRQLGAVSPLVYPVPSELGFLNVW